MKKIKAGMKVKVIYLSPMQLHFDHFGEEGVTCTVKNNRFFIRFSNGEETGWWYKENVKFLDNDGNAEALNQ